MIDIKRGESVYYYLNDENFIQVVNKITNCDDSHYELETITFYDSKNNEKKFKYDSIKTSRNVIDEYTEDLQLISNSIGESFFKGIKDKIEQYNKENNKILMSANDSIKYKFSAFNKSLVDVKSK